MYPLGHAKNARDDCIDPIRDSCLPLASKSGCFFCPFNTIERWHDLYQRHRNLYRKAMILEESSKHFPKQRLASPTLRILASEFRSGKVTNGVLPVEMPCGAECMT